MAGVVASQFKFMEELPDKCPPEVAILQGHTGVWRFVANNPPQHADFQSYAAIKPPPPTVPPCRWASTSVFVNKDAAFKKLPKPRERFNYIVQFNLTAGCGFSMKRKEHVDFWRFATFKIPVVLDSEKL